jgi:protein-S-isoprenylcysteine O-methyltransferase Ste14
MRLAGAVLIVAGVLLHRTAWRSFSVHGASPATLAVPAVLVEDGPYRHTRNPMYLAGVAILGGWALTAACPAGLGVAAAFALVARVRWIGPEERLLAATLGPAWADYSARVRRWV